MFPKRHKLGKKRKRVLERRIVTVSCFLILATAGTLGFHYVSAYSERQKEPVVIEIDPNLGVELFVNEFLVANEAEELLPVIECESEFKHYEPDGSALWNREGSSAVGVAQILTSKHPDPRVLRRYNLRNDTTLAPEDFNLLTLEGNLGYALVLYKVRGLRDWECAHAAR